MIGRIWEDNKMFIIGIVVAVIFLFAGHKFLVSNLNASAAFDSREAATASQTLKNMFKPGAEEYPTEQALKRYRTHSASIKSELDEIRNLTGFPIQAPFVLPQGEMHADIYYSEVKSRTMREIESAANARAIVIGSGVLAGEPNVDSSRASDALVSLAVVRRAILTAIAAGVSAIESVNYGVAERSAPVSDYKLLEKLVTVTVRGSPESVQEWMRALLRRQTLLMIASALIKGPDEKDAQEDAGVQCRVTLGPLTVLDRAAEETEEE